MKEAKKKLGVEDGIMGNLAGAAFERTKQAFPLGGRVGLGASGSIIGAAGGSLVGGAKSLGKGYAQAKQGDIIGGLGTVLKGTGSGLLKGGKKGASTAVNTVMNIERSAGIHQPDVLNPVTRFIDTGETPFKSKPQTEGGEGEPISIGKGLATGKNRERAAKKQEYEDFLDLAKKAIGTQNKS